MIIEVENLTKRYAGNWAVDGISFEVASGEIVGLLGPNGAGKSTTLRMLSCFMPATSGRARVAGYDVFTQPREVLRHVGYMPENNPLYREMRVREYLKFRARLKGLSRVRSRERVEAVIGDCGLGEVQNQVIGHLSKGFRQRVGLADALVHAPALVILDEPTIGLDPHQIRAVRELIKGLAGKHTVLLSTHILSEAEMICTRVLILNKGKILAADTPQNLQANLSKHSEVYAEIAAPVADLRACWEAQPEIEKFEIAPAGEGYHRCSLTSREALDLRPLVFEQARAHGWTLRELTRRRHSLEDIFVHITGGEKEADEEAN